MLLHLTLIIEIFTVIICIHSIYGRKINPEPVTAVSFLIILMWLELVNYYDLNGMYTCVSYILFGIYCKKKFSETWLHTLANMFLFFVILLILQFSSLVIAVMICPKTVQLQSFVGAMITFLVCVFVLPKFKLHKLSQMIQKRSKKVLGVVGFAFVFVLIMNVQNKMKLGIQVELYLLMIPMIIGILVLIYKWCFSQEKVERIEKEIQTVEKSKNNYDELLKSVRLKQHGFKNQLAAVLATQYTYDTYEKIERAQKQYYKQIVNENKHHKLLFLGDYIIAGFLYEKIIEAEADGIYVEYDLNSKIENYVIPVYYLVEILGILFDNAIEAVKEVSDNKVISVGITETDKEYVFYVSNSFRYVAYEELTGWFQENTTTKDEGRGLGLYHVKRICEQYNCTIGCGNVEEKGENRIQFILRVKKADSRL